jgi:hypothetical protein
MLNLFRSNLFNTRSFLLQTVGVFTEIQILVHQPFKLQSSNGEPRPSSSCKSYPSQAHSVLLFSNFISNFFCLLLLLTGPSRRNLDRCRGSITVSFLGPVGTSDPSEYIAAESQRIPFKASLSKPHEWQDAFKNWPLPPIAG